MTIQDTITLAQGQKKTVNVPATSKVFLATAQTGSFQVRPDNGNNQTVTSSQPGFGDGNAKAFKSLTFINTYAGSNTIEYTVSDAPIQTAVVASVTAASIANEIANCVAATPTQVLKTTTTAASPAQVAAVATYFRQALIIAVKTLAGAVNTSDVNLGFSATASQQPIVIPPGGTYVLEPPNGAKWNLADLYLTVATNGDGVVILYT